MSNFFSRFFKKKTTTPKKPKLRPPRTYTDTSSLAGIERASRTSKPSFFGDLAMGLGFKKKDTSFKIRTLQTIERNKKKKEKEAKERKAKQSDRDDERKRNTSGGGGTSVVAPPPPQKTQEQLYQEMLARELEARRKAGQEARKKYERRVGEEVAATRRKVQLLLL